MRAWKKYQKNINTGANTSSVSIMAYERCLQNLRYVKEKYEAFQFSDEKIVPFLTNTEQLLMELQLGLAKEDTPLPEAQRELVLEHAERMSGIYDWLIQEVRLARDGKKTEELKNIIETIETLLETEEIARKEVAKGGNRNGE